MRYKADITAGALKVPESRVIADLLLQEADDAAWKKALYDENVLQTRSPVTTKRLVLLIRGRLKGMERGLWKLVRDGTGDFPNDVKALDFIMTTAERHDRSSEATAYIAAKYDSTSRIFTQLLGQDCVDWARSIAPTMRNAGDAQ